MKKILKLRLAALASVAGMSAVLSAPANALIAGAAAATEVGLITTDVVPVGTAVVTVSVFVYGYKVIKRLIG